MSKKVFVVLACTSFVFANIEAWRPNDVVFDATGWLLVAIFWALMAGLQERDR